MLSLLKRRKTTTKAAPVAGGSWWNIGGRVRLPWPGSWQQNKEITAHDREVHFAVFACMTLIAGDISKLRLRIMQRDGAVRSEEHTSELQSRGQLVCRLLLEKKKKRLIKMCLQNINK